jgi:glycosyltransferase involved in cell wall biosynthesis
LKILHIYKTYYPHTLGGIESFIKELSSGCSKRGIESSVLCLAPQKNVTKIILDNISVYNIPSSFEIASTPFSLKALRCFKEIISDFDILHYQFPYPFADMLHLLFGSHKKTVVTYQSDIVKQKIIYPFYKPLQNLFLKKVDRIICTSPNYLQTSSILQKFKEKTSVIPIGLDKKNYLTPLEENIKKYKNLFGQDFFLFIGVLRYYKGLHTLIESAHLTGLPVVIAGDGPLKPSLQQLAKGKSNIHFIGRINDQEKSDLLAACTAFVFPSHKRSEAFGISLLEAAMFEKPLISCEIGTGTSFINIDDQTGWVISPENAPQLADAMQKFISQKDLAEKMGKTAYKRYEEIFFQDKMIDAYEKIYKELF